MKIYKLLVLCLTLTSVFAIPKKRKSHNLFPDFNFRLPNNTKPVFYSLHLMTYLNNQHINDFTGNVKIEIVAKEVTNTVMLHAQNLKIQTINLRKDSMDLVQKGLKFEFLNPKELDQMRINLGKRMKQDEHFVLEFVYNGTLRQNGVGLYRSFVHDKTLGDASKIYYIASQFQPTNARYAFPCYDEPDTRAQFSISVQHLTSYTALSNAEVVSRVPAGSVADDVVTTFETTPFLPTYALSIVVAPFVQISNNNTKIRQRIITHSSKVANNEADFALKQFGPILTAMEDELGVKFSLVNKLDHVAVDPYNYDGLGFYGLSIYRENVLLMNKNYTEHEAAEARKFCIQMIARIDAHQFFGSLVAPHWWTDLWLKEGFATLYEYYVPDQLFPEHNYMEDFREKHLKSLLTYDVPKNTSSLPISRYVQYPAEIAHNFHNAIAKSKASVVLRMFQVAFGFDTFRKGLQLYMQRRSFQSATPDDFFTALQEAVDQDLAKLKLQVRTLMSPWTYIAGYPLIYVTVKGKKLILEQHRFPTTKGEIYSVPLTFATRKRPNFNITHSTHTLWLTSEKMEIPLDFLYATDSDWIIFNVQQTGLYKMSYPSRLWRQIADALRENHEIVHPINREVLLTELELGYEYLEDVFISDVLHYMLYLKNETRYEVWTEAEKILDPIQFKFVGTEYYKGFLKFLQFITRTQLKKIGIVEEDGDSLNDYILREILVDYNCYALDPFCYDYNYKQITRLLQGHDVLVNFCVVFNNINTPAYRHFAKKIAKELTYPLRMPVLLGLTCTVKKEQFNFLIDILENRTNVLTDEERIEAISRMLYASNEGQLEALDYINKYPSMLVHDQIRSVLKNTINSKKADDKMQQILKRGKTYLTEKDYTDIQDGLRQTITWHYNNDIFIEAFFKLNNQMLEL